MSDSDKKEDELSNGFSNEIFVNENQEKEDNDDADDDGEDLVLEVDDKPWADNYLEDENYLLSNDLLYQLNPGIDFNINPFNKEKPMESSYSDHITNEKNDSNIVNNNFSNQSESYETKETKKESTGKMFPFDPQHPKPFPRVTSHPLQPQINLYSNINFPNNSFTMNGKSGWICSSCKNFNYEVRTQCNRCGREQILYNNYSLNPHSHSGNLNPNINTLNGGPTLTNHQYMNDVNININSIKSSNMISSMYSPSSSDKMLSMKYSHSYSPKAKKNNYDKKKKPFIEREGDWICYKCKNLNFAFRTNCNRCNLSKVENQLIIQSFMNTYTNNVNVQLVNKAELDEGIIPKDGSGTFECFNNTKTQNN